MVDAAAVTIAVLASPFGPVHVAATRMAVVGIELRTTRAAFEASLARRGLAQPRAAHRESPGDRRLLDRAISELDDYFDGRRRSFDLPIDLRGRSTWDRRALEAVRAIPFGQVASYGRVATAIGSHGAARAVGGAVGRNPIGLLVPCHRIIAGDGSIGGYGGAWSGDQRELQELKRRLLALEGVVVA
jgi:methylated-DNA-[protein]-cysteine S-methyltransferase